MEITLPWPPKEISPNAKRRAKHWSRHSKPTAQYRFVCFALAKGKGATGLLRAVRFYPPDRRHRDDDNMIGAFKAGRDGIADALGTDDNGFRPAYYFGPAVKGGMVVVDIH